MPKSTESTGLDPEDSTNTTATATATEESTEVDPKVDTDASETPETTAEPDTGEQGKEPVADKAKATTPAKEPTSAIQKAIDRLATDGPAKAAKPAASDKPEDKDSKPSDQESETEPKADSKAEGGPFANWTREERKHTKGTVKQRFAALDAKVKEYETKFKDVDPEVVEIGKSWDNLLATHDLDNDVNLLNPDQVAWTIKAQAAMVRTMQAVAKGQTPGAADLKVIDTVRQGLDLVDTHLGRSSSGIDLEKLETLVKEAGESLDLDALAAFVKEAKGKKPATKPAAPATTAPPAPTGAGTAEPNLTRPHVDPAVEAAREFYSGRFRTAMVANGAKPDQILAFFNANVLPNLNKILLRDFPQSKPDVAYQRLSPQLKHELHTEALQMHVGAKKSTTPPQPTTGKSDRPLRTTGGTTGSTGAPVGAVAAAISRLASDG